VRRLTALRRKSPALEADGSMIPLYAKPNKYPFVYLRQSGNERFLVAVNPQAKPASATVELDHPKPILLLGRGSDLSVNGRQVRIDMGGVSYGIYGI
jgi:glycosidase